MADRGEGESILQNLKNRGRDAQSALSEKLGETSAQHAEKLAAATAEVNQLVPLIRELGYAVESIRIGVGLIPDVAIEISGLTKTMDQAMYHRIMAEQKDKKLLCGVLQTLQTASALHGRIHIVGMRSDRATITLGLPPKVDLKFTP